MAKYTNSLTSHHGESKTSRADKMSGWIKTCKHMFVDWRGTMGNAKKWYRRKNRRFLNNPYNWDKI